MFMHLNSKEFLKSYELVICNGLCMTVPFDTACSPGVDFKQIIDNRILKSCTCNNTYHALNCNNDTYENIPRARSTRIDNDFLKQYERNKEYSSILNHKYNNNICLMEYKHVEFMVESVERRYNNFDNLTIIYTVNMLDYSNIDIHKDLLKTSANNAQNKKLFLNFETENIEYFTNNNNNDNMIITNEIDL